MVSLSTGRATVLRRAAVRATLAPSVHNSQPWRLHLGEDRLDVYADRSRQLNVLDPTSRQMVISVGCALMNARVSAAGDGIGVDGHRFPDPGRPDLLASLVATAGPADAALAELDHAIELRQTNRQRFDDDDVPDTVLRLLEDAAAAEDAHLTVLRDPVERASVAAFSAQAYEIESLDPAFRAERRAWTSDEAIRRDGLAGPEGRPVTHPAPPAGGLDEPDPCLALLGTERDRPTDWLRAGEALERVLLQITRFGFSATPLIQIAEVPSVRAQVRAELGLASYPHVLLRIGRARPTAASRRRRLVEVLVEDH